MFKMATGKSCPETKTQQSPSEAINIRNVADVVPLCESHLRGACTKNETCDFHHYTLPYLWQVHIQDQGWQSLLEHSENVEKAYCDLKDYYKLKIPATSADGSTFSILTEFDLKAFQVRMSSPHHPVGGSIVALRRLRTQSYSETIDKLGSDTSDVKYHTQWRWYWLGSVWKLFNQDNVTPPQHILESKFLSQQDIYRFVIQQGNPSVPTKNRRADLVCLLNYQEMQLTCLNDNMKWRVARRPLFVSRRDVISGKHLNNPTVHICPFLNKLPDDWNPIDTRQQYEMIPLNPDSMVYHLVASEFHSSITSGCKKILDIFRIQNPFLWNQYSLKKKLLETKFPKMTPERQLFHGTSDETVVQAICRDNFDWRVCGKNNTVFGRGSYFAKNAAYSDKYAKSGAFVKWMFMARVLVGRIAKGNSSLVRPPPIDAAFPHGELYESCVDQPLDPSIFVVFERDQCYPEYLISYR